MYNEGRFVMYNGGLHCVQLVFHFVFGLNTGICGVRSTGYDAKKESNLISLLCRAIRHQS